MTRENSRKRIVPLLIATAVGVPLPSAATQEPESTNVTDVVFIGANHDYTFLHPGFSAHIRALLSKIDPAALCIELTPDWPRDEGIPTWPQELYAALTWARAAGVPVHEVDWYTSTPPPIVRMDESMSLLPSGPDFEAFLENHLGWVRFTVGQAFGLAPNDIEFLHRSRFFPLTVDQWPQEDSVLSVRDDRIAENIRGVLARYPGQRVAVVFGLGHYVPLKRRLESSGDVRVLPPLQYFPLERERVEAGWHPDDAIVLLGTNLDDWRSIASPQSRNHQRSKELLDRLRGERPASVVTRYYDARFRMVLCCLEEASQMLRAVVDEGGRTTVPYRADTRWSWPPFRAFEQKARFYVAVASDLAGDRETALREYEALMSLPDDELVVPAPWPPGRRLDLRPYLASFMSAPFQGGILEAYRASIAMGR